MQDLRLSSAAQGIRVDSGVPGIWWCEVIDLCQDGLSAVEGKQVGSQGSEG